MTTAEIAQPNAVADLLASARYLVSVKVRPANGGIRCADCFASQRQATGHFEGATSLGDHYSCPIAQLDAAIKVYDLQALESIDISLQTFTTDCGWCGNKEITVSGFRNDEGQVISHCPTEGCDAKLVMSEPILTA
jgi:hypothetical protein